ncbi:unnamed protein product [marine sediment metagenome]|uniref:Transglutaminase-like domain-containing protein n=1 Tax=marine sediment metagenome TaxID=412755 RepID=X1KB46_9ZZZZ
MIERKSVIPEPYQTIARRELRKLPTWKLQEAYGKLRAGESTGIELVEQNRAYAISAIEEILWERGKLPSSSSHSSGKVMANKEDAEALKALLPAVGIGAAVIVAYAVLVRVFALGRRAGYQDGRYLVSVRYPGQWHDIREFIQPHKLGVVAFYSDVGPDVWGCLDLVCHNISYRQDIGEFWQFPSETIWSGAGDCEDSSNLLTSLLRNFTNAYTVLGSYQGWGHAWVASGEGEILEATFTQARPVPDPQDYCPYCMFNESEVIELWPGALSEVFELGRNEELKLI